jgi:hypothetical protein
LTPDPEANDVQLALIGELTTLLAQAGIAHWLFGGWAVDFHAGAVTRPHGDIDLIVWREDASAVRKALVPHGYVEAPPPSEESGLHTHFSKEGQQIDAIFVYQRPDGSIYWSDWRWPDGSFTGPSGRLGEGVCPVVSARTLLQAKESYLREGPDECDARKCHLDAATLRRLLGDPQPQV